MTRKEEICDVTKEQFTYVKDENLKSALRFAFIDGAKWADEHPNLESLWHDASEKPNKNSVILAQWNIKGNSGYEFYYAESINWERFVEIYGVSIWAYINNLLPKQFGNSEQLKGGEK